MAGTTEGLGRSLWNDSELQAFSTGENTKNYQKYKSQLEDNYDKTRDNFFSWLANGVSGNGWTKKGYLEKNGITDDVDAYGGAGQLGSTAMGSLRDANSAYNQERNSNLNAGKGLFSGIPIIGGILDPMAQTASAGKDLATSGTSKWQNGDRDWLSDVGALGETALTIGTLGAGGAAAGGAKTLGSTVGKGALLGAGYGLTGSLNEMGAKNFDAGQLALSTGLGGAIGGGLAGAGYGLGKAWNKYSQPKASSSTDLVKYTGGNAGNSAEYQNALNTLKEAGIDTTSPETISKTFRKFSTQNHPDLGGSADYFTKVNNAKTTYQNLLNNAGTNTATSTAYTAPTLSFTDKLKNVASNIPTMGQDLANTKAGTKISSLLSTKKGKIGAGVAGGLLLAKLLGGNNSSTSDMSDEELAELYNYYYGGQ